MGTIFAYPGSPLALASASGGKTYALHNVGTSAILAVAANPQRQQITFHNPHVSIDMYVAMARLGTGAANNPTVGAPAGAFKIFAGGILIVSGECQDQWNAFAGSAGGELTIMDSNV